MGKDGAILGMALWNTSPKDLARIFKALNAGLANGSLAPVVSTELPLADAARAHEMILQPGAKGKIVLVP
jgi:NADPH2:quinone reductase